MDYSNIKTSIDNARSGKKLALYGGLISLVFMLSTLIFGVANAKVAGSDTFAVAVAPFALAVLFAIGVYLESAFAEMAAKEEEEKALLAKRKESSLLETAEDVRFTSGAALANYRRYAPYVLALLAVLLTGGILAAFEFSIRSRLPGSTPVPNNAMQAAMLSAMMLFGSVFSGAFFLGQSRNPAFRNLRPIGSYLIVGFLAMILALAVDVSYYNLANFDRTCYRILFWLLAILGAELVFNLVIEFYRPRTAGVQRPLYESKLLSIFTEPGGVVRNLSDALDYQFGFKMSQSWLYAFVEKSIFPLIAIFLMFFWLSTSIHEVQPGEKGAALCFGRLVDQELLKPGLYLTLPYPFGNMKRVNCDEIKTVTIGFHADENDKTTVKMSEVILWTQSHLSNEKNYLVAADPVAPGNPGDAKMAHPVSFVGLSVPVQYRVKNAMDFLYNTENPAAILFYLTEQTVIEYLTASSLQNILSAERLSAERDLQKKLQRLVDANRLGIEIVAVNLLDMHPPVGEVSVAYQNVIGAMEKSETMQLEAMAYKTKVASEADARKEAIRSESESYKEKVAVIARAEKELFERQLAGFRLMPEYYRLNAYLSVLQKNSGHLRKFLIGSGMASEIYELNFEEKARLDLIDADLNTLIEKKK